MRRSLGRYDRPRPSASGNSAFSEPADGHSAIDLAKCNSVVHAVPHIYNAYQAIHTYTYSFCPPRHRFAQTPHRQQTSPSASGNSRMDPSDFLAARPDGV